MNKRKFMNITSIVLGLVVLLLIILPAPMWLRLTYLVTGLSSVYVGISGLRIK